MKKVNKSETKQKKITEVDDSENVVVVKLSATSEKFVNELGNNKVELTQECADIDKHTDTLEAKVSKMVKAKYDSEEEHFADLRNVYIQIASCIGRLDDITGKVIHALNNMFKAKKTGDVEEIEDDENDDDQPTKIGKPKSKESTSSKKKVVESEEEDEDEKPSNKVESEEVDECDKKSSKKKVVESDGENEENEKVKKPSKKKVVESDGENEENEKVKKPSKKKVVESSTKKKDEKSSDKKKPKADKN
jgi:hypothetical protein